ncbi:uncharacterized protein LOC121379205 isoform X2 [Gigantopelta aegis]|uniref:uncharacterized protein LOC121379205 isoform X2 n=1 Tax=Gigantopelta aegis TaxID=1735272 RepID=UPI001B888CCD|nr:uncharacterized protein LOC121379205 isoform X2 [Gigantopelta aegis]
MRYTMLVFVILGLVASVSCVCNTTAAWTCASTLASEVIDAGIDNAKVCRRRSHGNRFSFDNDSHCLRNALQVNNFLCLAA